MIPICELHFLHYCAKAKNKINCIFYRDYTYIFLFKSKWLLNVVMVVVVIVIMIITIIINFNIITIIIVIGNKRILCSALY
jgi:hypothetical protein